HWKAGLRVLKFLRKTRDWGVTFQKTGQMRLYAYADSSYGGDEDYQRSVSGGAVMFAGSVVAWFSRTQQAVALSSTEAEYMAMGVCNMLKQHYTMVKSVTTEPYNTMWVYEDNMGAINLAENPSSSARSKHTDTRHRFLRQLCS
ncbi:unnamed protein product, partial [Discosporangium mesarthrocarpum]